MTDVLSQLQKLEELFVSRSGNNWLDIIKDLLSDTFVEIGSSGKTYDKKQTLQELHNIGTSLITLSDFRLLNISQDTYLLFYTANKGKPGSEQKSLRSSVWQYSEGKWQILFHQGTILK